MSHYKHIYNAVDNAMRHIQQAQECCRDAMHIDKDACGNWKRQLKEAEKQIKSCYKSIESKHKKSTPVKETIDYRKKRTTIAEKLQYVLESDQERDLEHQSIDYYEQKLENGEPLGVKGLIDYIFNK